MPRRISVWIVATLLVTTSGLVSADCLAASRGSGQAARLADLSAQIVACTVHPCLSDDETETRTLLREQIVTDGVFYYSDVNVAYPTTTGNLEGLVEWDEGSIYFKIVKFQASRAVLLHELEQALPGCEMDQDDDHEWSCTTTDRESAEVSVDVFFAPGLVLLELDL